MAHAGKEEGNETQPPKRKHKQTQRTTKNTKSKRHEIAKKMTKNNGAARKNAEYPYDPAETQKNKKQ